MVSQNCRVLFVDDKAALLVVYFKVVWMPENKRYKAAWRPEFVKCVPCIHRFFAPYVSVVLRYVLMCSSWYIQTKAHRE